MNRLFLIALLVLMLAAPSFGQTDETAKPYHIFPQVADGTFPHGAWFETWFLVTSVMPGITSCDLRMYGVDLNRLALDIRTSILSLATGAASFTLRGQAVAFLMPTKGTSGTLETGHATVSCDRPVTARALYRFSDPYGSTNSMATVFSSPMARNQTYYTVQGQGYRMAIAVVNNSNRTSTCRLGIVTEGIIEEQIVFPPYSHLAAFVDEYIIFDANDFYYYYLNLICDYPVSSIGLLFHGNAFTTVPATVIQR